MPPLPSLQMSPLHVIFYLNGVFIATCFDKGACPRAPSQIVKLGLKELLERCVTQFHGIFGLYLGSQYL